VRLERCIQQQLLLPLHSVKVVLSWACGLFRALFVVGVEAVCLR
jgi:hypothetical protein